MDLSFLWSTTVKISAGLPVTLLLSFSAIVLGFILAIILTWSGQSRFGILRYGSKFYVFAFRGSPLLIQIFLLYYGAGQFRSFFQSIGLWHILREPMWCAILALSMNTAAYVSEIMRGAFIALPNGQIEVARASGMSGLLLFRRIMFPIATRQALPAYGNEIILIIKSTSLASVITILDMTGIATGIINETYRTIEVFVVAGFLYLALNFIITRVIALTEWWLSPHLRPYQDKEQEIFNG